MHKSPLRRTLLAALALVIAVGLGFLIGHGSKSTTTVASPHVLVAPPDSPPRVEAQKRACPDTERVEPASEPEAPALPECVATLAPEQLRGAITPPPYIVGSAPADPPNGQYPASALSSATGCSRGLATNAAAAWNHVAVVVHDHTGYWLQSNGDASCYRTYGQQVELRNYWCGQGNCANAAVPGTSNHGWGLAVDAPPQTVAYIHRYASGLFGQGYGSCSDAPWEGWHIKYCGGWSGKDPGPYGHAVHHFNALERGDSGDRVKTLSTRLALLRRTTSRHPHYIAWKRRTSHYDRTVAYGVRRLQRDCDLVDDGVYGAHTNRCMAHRWAARKRSH
jgi:hypothetical protein